jgi:hypothetical protein
MDKDLPKRKPNDRYDIYEIPHHVLQPALEDAIPPKPPKDMESKENDMIAERYRLIVNHLYVNGINEIVAEAIINDRQEALDQWKLLKEEFIDPRDQDGEIYTLSCTPELYEQVSPA